MMEISVQAQQPYKISIQNNAFEQFGAILKPYMESDAILVFDAHIPWSVKEKIVSSFKSAGVKCEIVTLQKSGEDIKTISFFEEFCRELPEKYGITRKTTLVAVGGGTVGDFIGFVASSLMRGMPFIQVPTTLLSMVDSSVGGKVAVNIGQYKNFIGSFYQPKHVLIETAFLETLPNTELISGYAEVLKYGLIRSSDFYRYLIQNGSIFTDFLETKKITGQKGEYLMQIIGQSCMIKAQVVREDEFETKQIREILNFGHTFGHAFEGLYLGKMPHGVAVGIGMVCALKYSGIDTAEIEKHYAETGLFSSIKEFCRAHNMVGQPSTIDIIKLMAKDKKNTENRNYAEIEGIKVVDTIKLVLLKKIGDAKIENVRTEAVYSFLCDL